MEKIRMNQDILKKYSSNQFVVDSLFPILNIRNAYLIDSRWSFDIPKSRPDDKRFFMSRESFRTFRDIFNIWNEFKNRECTSPVFPNKILDRVSQSRMTGQELTLFIPWGVREKGEPNLELEVMDDVKSIRDFMVNRGVNASVLIMPADVYALEINNFDKVLVNNYFNFVENEANKRNFLFKPWSKIKGENIKKYEEYRSELVDLSEILPYQIIEGAGRASIKRNGNKDASILYLKERIVEAKIIEEQYYPIKISMVAPNKDAIVDGELPRLYLIKEEKQFPWIK